MEWKWWIFAPKLADEHQILWDSCTFAPFQVLLDNVEVNDLGCYATSCPLAIHYQHDGEASLPAPAPSSLRAYVQPDLDRELYHSWAHGTPAAHPLKFRKKPAARVRWVAYVPVSKCAGKYESGLYPVIAGVTAERLPMAGLPTGTTVLMWADDLDTDLSGLRLIENARFQERVEEIGLHLHSWRQFQQLS